MATRAGKRAKRDAVADCTATPNWPPVAHRRARRAQTQVDSLKASTNRPYSNPTLNALANCNPTDGAREE